MCGCKLQSDKGRYDWRHNSVFLNLTRSILATENLEVYADFEGYKNPSLITGDEYRPDLIVVKMNPQEITLFELTIGFETNVDNNTENKYNRYKRLLEN